VDFVAMGFEETTQLLNPPRSNFHTAIVGLTPREAGVNAVGKKGVNAVEISGLTPWKIRR